MYFPEISFKKFYSFGLKSLFSLIFLSILVIYGIILGYSPPIGAVLLAGLVYVITIFLKPFWGTLIYVFFLAFADLAALPITSGGLSLSTVVLLTGYLIWAVRALLVKDSNLFIGLLSRATYIFILAFFAIMVVSVVNSINRGYSIRQIQQFIYCMISVFLIAFTVTDRKKIQTFLLVVFWAGFLVSLIGVWESITHVSIYQFLGNRSIFMAPLGEDITLAHIGRINGPIGDAPFHGIYMVIISCLALYYVFNTESKRFQQFSGLTFLLSIYNILVTASRGALVAFLLAMLIFWLKARIKHKTVIISSIMGLVLLLGVGTVILSPNMDIKRLVGTSSKDVAPLEMRLQNFFVALTMFADHPFIGTGPEGFILNFPHYAKGISPSSLRARTLKTHNTPIQILAEYGLLGAFTFFLILYLTFKTQFKLLEESVDDQIHMASLAILCAYAGFVFFMFTSNSLMDKNLWMLIAFSEALYSVNRQESIQAVDLPPLLNTPT